jgi:hypothetical protein
MYLFYLDESGSPGGWSQDDNFVIAGAAIHEGQVYRLSKRLDAVQEEFFPDIPVPLELHAEHIYNGRGRFRRMPEQARAALLARVYDVIRNAGYPNLIAFASAVHVTAAQSPEQVFRACLGDICSRFNLLLLRRCKKHRIDKGLLIMDQSGREAAVRSLLAEFQQSGTRLVEYLGNIVDVPYFSRSRDTRMLQFADFLAFAAGRFFNRGDSAYLEMVLPCIDRRSQKGPLDGLSHIVGVGHACSCMACHAPPA